MGEVIAFPGTRTRERGDDLSTVQREMLARLRTAERRVLAGEVSDLALVVILNEGKVWFSWAGSSEPLTLSTAASGLAAEIARNPINWPKRGE
jgi:hypothetical protein